VYVHTLGVYSCIYRNIKNNKILKYSLCCIGRIKENKRKCGQTQEKTKGAESAYIERTQIHRQFYQGKLSDIDKCGQGSKQ
ncbi:hypothetical protein NERG_02602, partial [Nematocida ausubeli]